MISCGTAAVAPGTIFASTIGGRQYPTFTSYREAIDKTAPGEYFFRAEGLGRFGLFQRERGAASRLADAAESAFGGLGFRCETLEALARMPPLSGLEVELAAGGRGCVFRFAPRSQHVSALCRADNAYVIAIPYASRPELGAFVRHFDGPVKAEWFGVAPGKVSSASWASFLQVLPYFEHGGVLPPGELFHDGDIVVSNTVLAGSPSGTTLVARRPDRSWIRLQGEQPKLQDMRIVVADSDRRLRNTEAHAIVGFGARGLHIENVSVSGAAGAGIYLRECIGGRIERCTVTHTKADGFHLTHGTRGIAVTNCHAMETGDDGFAVVSYAGTRFGICRDIRFEDVVSERSSARGLAIVGGQRVTALRPKVTHSGAAGCYVSSEAAYDTYGTLECRLESPLVIEAGQSAKINNAAIQIGGRAGSSAGPDGAWYSNASIDCTVTDARIEGGGSGLRAAVALDPYSERCVVSGVYAENVVGNQHRPADLVQLNGFAGRVERVRARNIGGFVLNVGRTATGRQALTDAEVEEPRTGRVRYPGLVFVQPAPGLKSLFLQDIKVELSHAQSAGRSSFVNRSASVAATKLVLSRVTVNGEAIR